MKRCRKCGEVKALAEFYRSRGARDGPQRVRAWAEKNRDKRLKKLREIHLRNKFGLAPDEYDRILDA